MPKSVDELINGALMHAYDPQKAHQYYEEHKHLKGRQHGSNVVPFKGHHADPHPAAPHVISPAVQQQITALKGRLAALEAHLRELLASKRKDAQKKPEHKTAAQKAKDARDSKKYRQEHKTELAQKRKQDASKSGGGSSSGPTAISDMTEAQLRTAIARTRANLQAAVAKARG